MALSGKGGRTNDNLLSLISIPNHLPMKTIYLALLLMLLSLTVTAQTETYTINGNSYELKKEVDGALTLLWNVINQDYRYFAEKEGVITELVNTETNAGYQEEYRATLRQLIEGSNISVEKVNLTLGSLRNFFNKYNASVDSSYVPNSFLTALELRLGGFVGVTNNVFTNNPDNISNTQFGIDFEILDPTSLPRHSMVVQYKQALASDDYDYSALQLSINYRFKFVQTTKVDLFLNTKLVSMTSFKPAFPLLEEGEMLTDFDDSRRTNFQAPIIFGLGADVRLGKGFLTFNYHDAFAVFLESNDEFPVDVSIGYKFVL